MAIAALVLGIVSCVQFCIPYANWFAFIPACVGTILGALSLKGPKRGMAMAGMILSIVSTAIFLLVVTACSCTACLLVNY